MPSYQELLHDNGELRAKLDEAEETLRAIRNGEVDALIVSTSQGNQVFTLQSADHPYRVLIEEMHEGAITILVDGVILYCNRRFGEIVSYPLEAMLSRSIYQHFMPEDRQRFTEFIQAAQLPESIYGEFTLQNQQGEPIPVHIGANALQFSQLLILGLVVTDLRERKQAEGELARLASIVTSSNDAIIGETLDGIITSWNRGAERIFGYSADEVIQKPITILMPSENAGEDMVLMQKVVAGETVRNYDAIRLKKDGNVIFVSVSISPIKDHKGGIIGVSKIFQDATERKQAEQDLQNLYNELEKRVVERTTELQMSKERVEAILNSSADAILLLKGDFSIQQTNASFNSLFASEQDDYFGKSLNALLDANDSDSMNRLLQAAADQSRLAIDVEARRKDDTVFAAELSIGFIRDDSFVCTFHDISERKKIEQSLQMAFKKEKELNELKTRFVSMASHEFRTPLATIYAATETLSAYRHKLTQDQIELKLSNIRGQVGYLKDIMDDVLKLAQLQMRRVAFNPDTVDFDALCREVIDEYQNGTDITHDILYSCASGLPTAQLDKKLMWQLVSNLVSNAIKYSPHNKTITLNLEYTAKTLVFSVTDSGIGIPEDDLEHLFEPFHRAANVGTIHGTGLGLVIAKESVELHGGTITVESQISIGTTVTIHIPIKTQGV